MQTHLGYTMDAIEEDKARYDKNVKEILSDVQILARILKYTVDEVKELSVEEIIHCIDNESIRIGKTPIQPGLTNLGKIENLETEDNILNEGYIAFDIRFSLICRYKLLKLIVNIEAQKSTEVSVLHYHIENRMVYYLSRLISSQKEVEFFHSDYDDIKKVYSIWICMDADDEQDSIHKISLKTENIFGAKLNFPQLDKMCGIVIRIRKNKDIKESKNKLIAMLEDVLVKEDSDTKKEKLKVKYGMKMANDFERRIEGMCNLSDVVFESAMEEGMKKGMEKGLEKGIKAGIEQAHITLIERMLKKGKSIQEIEDLTGYNMNEIISVQNALLQTV